MKGLARSVTHFFSGTMLSRISGVVRDSVMAAAFGSAPIVSIFYMAFRFANLPRRLFGEGAMHAAFIPQYEKLAKEEKGKGEAFFRDLTYVIGLVTILLAFLLFFCLPRSSSLLRLIHLFCPFLPAICLYGLHLAYHNCKGAFFKPSVAPIFSNLLWVIGALLLWGEVEEGAMGMMAIAVGVGFVLQWVVVAYPLWQELKWGGVKLWSPDIKRCLKSLGLALLGVGASQVNSALDPLFAYAADPRAPSYLWFAFRLQQLPLALFGIALSSVILPPLARASDRVEYEKIFNWGKMRLFELVIPCTFGILVAGLPSVALLFFRGQFRSEDCLATTSCLYAYGLGLVPMSLVLLRTAAFHSKGDYRTPAIASALSVGMNIALNTCFIFGLHLSGMGVALATSLSAVFQAGFLKSRLGEKGGGALWPFLASLASAFAALLVDFLIWGEAFWNRPVPSHLVSQLTALGIPVLTFSVIYFPLMIRRLRLKV